MWCSPGCCSSGIWHNFLYLTQGPLAVLELTKQASGTRLSLCSQHWDYKCVLLQTCKPKYMCLCVGMYPQRSDESTGLPLQEVVIHLRSTVRAVHTHNFWLSLQLLLPAHGFWGSNWCPCACKASTLPTELSPRPQAQSSLYTSRSQWKPE